MVIIPTIQTDSLAEAQARLDSLAALQIKGITVPTHLQFDIVDGLYADDLTLMPHQLKDLNFSNFTFETHLLTIDPEEFIGEADDAGATAIIAQIERLRDRLDFLKVVKALNHQAGLALDLYTPISELTDAELQLADIILLMAVPAGFSGQTQKPEIFNQIKGLKERGYTKTIEIDGGVNSANLPQLLAAGATHLAVNSALWQDDVSQNLATLLASLKESAHAPSP
jgi:ribulose-phosphate 3-epimerase